MEDTIDTGGCCEEGVSYLESLSTLLSERILSRGWSTWGGGAGDGVVMSIWADRGEFACWGEFSEAPWCFVLKATHLALARWSAMNIHIETIRLEESYVILLRSIAKAMQRESLVMEMSKVNLDKILQGRLLMINTHIRRRVPVVHDIPYYHYDMALVVSFVPVIRTESSDLIVKVFLMTYSTLTLIPYEIATFALRPFFLGFLIYLFIMFHLNPAMIPLISEPLTLKLLLTCLSPYTIKIAANKLGCLVLKTPFTYLGTKVGENMHRKHAWNEVVEKVLSRLSRWKLKTLSIGGRFTLLKSVLGSMPIFHMSIFKVPSSILNSLEVIRSRFFNGHEHKSNKATWFKWNKVLTSKEKGGLGVSSLFALNRGLLFKWLWRFYSQKDSLWTKVIKALYGEDGSLDKVGASAARTCWTTIVQEVKVEC
ncbi:hypothetical protein Tco_0913824 [Tanacetum coccineum]